MKENYVIKRCNRIYIVRGNVNLGSTYITIDFVFLFKDIFVDRPSRPKRE